MKWNIIGAVLAFAAGILVAAASYLVSRNVLIKKADKLSVVSVVRQVLQICYLAAVLVLSKVFQLNAVYTLVGAVLGMTLPMFFFTKMLLKVNEGISVKESGKEDDERG
ncbi:MAG: hypothetical protein PUC33_01540 [Oscillospiraceae bacterium]|nr:hypothetical protein [Oscillospiraceae bacterium]